MVNKSAAGIRSDEAEMDLLFHALADSTRRGMIAQLTNGPVSIGRLGRAYPISKPAVTKHVKLLERAGLVRRDREGRIHRLTLRPQAMRRAEEWIEKHRRFWESSLDSLADYVQSVKTSTPTTTSRKRRND